MQAVLETEYNELSMKKEKFENSFEGKKHKIHRKCGAIRTIQHPQASVSITNLLIELKN